MRFGKTCITSFMIILLTVSIVLTGSFFANADTLDLYWGRGELFVDTPENRSGWETEYYAPLSLGEVRDRSSEVCKQITDEGIVLLKNDELLPLEKMSKVTPFGCRYYYPVYTGRGSGNKKSEAFSPEESLKNCFIVSECAERVMRAEKVKELSATGLKETVLLDDGSNFFGNVSSIYEFDPKIYRDYGDVSDTVGIVFIGRYGGEDYNFSTQSYYDGTPHALALTQYERETILTAKQKCSAVVAVINSANPMQIGELMAGDLECNAIIWLGGGGATGFLSLAQILCGEVNPSGRTVDLWSRDFLSDPTVKNFEDIRYSNAEGIVLASNYNSPEKPAGLYFLEYEEGIYLGYRYYETASDIGAIRYGSTDERGRLGQAGAVNYPFGYGLSYTRFEQTVKEVVKDETSLGVLVQVENTGSRDGSEVVQIYYKAPYTQYDAANGVEKSTKNLIAFEKVYIPAGEKREVLLRFNLEDMASYAYKHPNRDGTCGCYMLEAGEYMLYLGKNSHDSFCSFSVKIPDTIFYEGDNMRLSDKEAQSKRTEDGFATEFPQNAAKGYCSVSNRFEDVTAYMLKNDVTLLSRKSWLTTFPTAPEKKALDAVRLKRAVTYNPYTDARTGNVATNPDYTEDYPAQKAEPTLKFSDMRGIDYYDAAWDDFLDALDLGSEEVRNLLLKAAGHTGEISAVNKPATFDTDGPQGLKRVETNFDYEAYGYAGQIVLGATFNKRLGYAFGEAVGKEALQTGVNGWYAPGLNLHRGPFGGRNYEYFSEDPLLSGKMGAQVISGAADCGLLTYVKHFAMNNYEGPATCLSVWATEQTIRELYLKSFEIAVKESRRTVKYIRNIQGEAGKKIMRGCMGIMGAANLIGTEWCAANYDLLQGVLRGEWGFTGAVTTDMSLQVSHGIVDKIFRCGGDLRMYYREAELLDDNSATMSVCIRRAVKNVCFAYVNGNIMQGVSPGAIITYKISPWKIWLLSIDAVILVAEIVCVILLVRRKRLNARRSSKLT